MAQIAPATASLTPLSLTETLALAGANSSDFQAALVAEGIAQGDKTIARAALLASVNYLNTYAYTQGGRAIGSNGVRGYLSQGASTKRSGSGKRRRSSAPSLPRQRTQSRHRPAGADGRQPVPHDFAVAGAPWRSRQRRCRQQPGGLHGAAALGLVHTHENVRGEQGQVHQLLAAAPAPPTFVAGEEGFNGALIAIIGHVGLVFWTCVGRQPAKIVLALRLYTSGL